MEQAENAIPVQPAEVTDNLEDARVGKIRRPFPRYLFFSNFLFVTASALYLWMAVEDYKWSGDLQDFPLHVREATDDATWENYRVREWQKAIRQSMNSADVDDGNAEAGQVAVMSNTSEAVVGTGDGGVDNDMDDEITPRDPSIYYDFWWEELPLEIQEGYSVLGYDENSWNNAIPVAVEDMSWNQLTLEQQNAAAFLGFTQDTWNGEDSYDDYDWVELPPEIQDAAIVLGYDQSIWDDSGTPETEDYWWNELSEEQQKAAAVFGYDQYSWDGVGTSVEQLGNVTTTGTNPTVASAASFYEFSLWDDDFLFQVAGTDAWVSKYQIVYFVAATLFVFVGLLDVIRERKLFHILMIFAGLNGVASAVFVESDPFLSNLFSSISVHFFLLEGISMLTGHRRMRASFSADVEATQLLILKLLAFADILFVIGVFLDLLLSYFWLFDDTSDWDSTLQGVGVFAATSWLLCPMIYLSVTLFDYFAFRDELHEHTEDTLTDEDASFDKKAQESEVIN